MANKKNWNKIPNETPPKKIVDIAHAEIDKAKKKRSKRITSKKKVSIPCDVNGCDFIGGSKSVVTRHWNAVHRSKHGQKRNARKANQDQGRPTVLTPQVVAKLVAAFQNGLTKTQAFRYAGISKDAYYDNMKKDEAFADKMRDAQEHLNFKAREVIAQAITNGSDMNARWWLERKAKDEFSPRREVTGNGGGPVKTKNTNIEVEVNDEELNEALFG